MTEISKELQERHMELQMLDQHAKQIQKQIETVDTQMGELLSVKQGLDELSAIKAGSETLVPISPGIFVKGIIKDAKKLIVNVGGNVAVKKTIPETQQLLEKQAQSIHDVRNQLVQQLQQVVEVVQIKQEEALKLIEEQNV
ncbi:MAG: prefoldin subunit alpha [archaeon]